MPRIQANFVALASAYLILSYLRANPIGLARHVTSRDRVGRVGHSARILRPSHPVGLGNLPDPRVRVGRVNPIGLKPDPTVTLDSARRLRLTNLDNTSNIWVTLDVPLKFLVMLETCLELIESINITLELRYRHNNLGSLELLIESLESYFELLIQTNLQVAS